MKQRDPIASGMFYPSDPGELKELMEQLFTHRLGPGRKPQQPSGRIAGVVGYVVPHAGYVYSGPVASHVYYDLSMRGLPDTIIIIGTNHTGLGAPVSVFPGGSWRTPLGELKVDEEVAKAIVENSEIAELDIEAHLEEHSIEVQLPFIQYIYGDSVTIVPVVTGIHTPEVATDLANAITISLEKTGRSAVILASSDFNHYDPHEITVEKDQEAIQRILSLDVEGFYATILRRGVTVCGPGGIMTLMQYARRRGLRPRLLKYATSGDVSGDKSFVVGYASILFEKQGI